MSTTANTINLIGKEYPFRFGIKFQRVFMNHFKLKKIDAFQKKISTIDQGTLEGTETLGVVVLCAIQAASKTKVSIDPDDIIDFIMENGFESIQPMMDAMQQAQPDTESTPNAVGKSKK